jgi:hypothetical protein
MYVPKWFLRELKIIDPTYFVTWNDEYQYFEIRKKMNMEKIVEVPGKEILSGEELHGLRRPQLLKITMRNPTVAVFKILNDQALIDMRKRKYIGLKFQRNNDPLAYLKWIMAQNKEAKAKKEEIAHEMITDGIMKMHKLETSKTFDMGGNP